MTKSKTGKLSGSGRRARRSAGVPLACVLAVTVVVPLDAILKLLDASVTRKARTRLIGPRVKPAAWWGFRPRVPTIDLAKIKKPGRPRNTELKCLHCGATSTPLWRQGPMGPHTLCNACGLRYRQGRLLPEYRPAASPSFLPTEHASWHRNVLQLRQGKEQHVEQANEPVADDGLPNLLAGDNPFQPTSPQAVDNDQRVGGNNGAVAGSSGGGDQMDALDLLLLDGPSAPLIIDDSSNESTGVSE